MKTTKNMRISCIKVLKNLMLLYLTGDIKFHWLCTKKKLKKLTNILTFLLEYVE